MKINKYMKILKFSFTLLTFSFLVFPFDASAGVIRKPPNNLGLVMYYPMDEGSGTVVTDHSGNNKTGMFAGAGTAPSWSTGKRGGALSFSGVTNVSRVETSPNINLANTHTVSAWIYLTNNCIDYGTLLSDNGNTGLYCLRTGFPLKNKITYYPVGSSSSDITLNQWHHIAVANNASSVTFYLDGVPDGTTSSAPAYTATAIGNDDLGEKFLGKIDDLRVYNRAFSAAEVLALYKSGSVKVGLTDLSPGTLKNGLTGYWTFDGKDMVSNVADVSGNGRNGFLTNFTSTTTSIGKIGQALAFNNTNKYVETTGYNYSDFITASDGTISAWIRPQGASPSCNNSIWYGCDFAISSNGPLTSFGIGRGNNTTFGTDKIWATNNVGSWSTVNAAGVDYTLGEWVHITWVHTGGTLSIYKNGEFASSTSSGNTLTSILNNNMWIGRGYSGNNENPWNGDVDDVRTWNRALTAGEIKQVYNIGAGQKVSTTKTPVGTLADGLKGHWTFDGGDTDWTTNTVTDKSGNGNTGTLTNMSTSTSPVAGKIGQGLNFVAASTQRVALGTSSTIQPTANFSVSLWYKGLKGTTESFVSSGPNIGNYWDIENGGAVFSTSGLSISTSYSLPSDNEWHHLVVVLDRTPSPDELTVYIDGVSQGFATDTLDNENVAGGGGMNIGRGTWAGGGYRQGPMDDVRIYNRVLSASEVQQLYQLGR